MDLDDLVDAQAGAHITMDGSDRLGTDAVAPRPVARGDVQRLVAEGAQLVEVLPADEYDEEHLPGAIHLPLKHLTREAAEAALDRARPVVVYCWDAL